MHPNTSIEEIATLEQDLLNAMQGRNVQKLDELLHDDLLFNIPSGQTFTKAMDLEGYRLGNMNIESISSRNMEISLIGDTAVVAVSIEMRGKFLEHPLDGVYRFLRVWKQFDDQWKVIGGSSIPLAEGA